MYQLTFPWCLLLMFLSCPDISVACFSFISKSFTCPAIVNGFVLILFSVLKALYFIPCNCMKVKMKSLSRVRLFATSCTQAPPSVGLSRQEYWSGLPFPSPGVLPKPGIESRSPALQADVFTLWATRDTLLKMI